MATPIDQDTILLINACIVALVVFIALRFLKKRGDETNFRDDIWANIDLGEVNLTQDQKRTIESQVDRLAIEGPESATRRPHGQGRSGNGPTASRQQQPDGRRHPNFRGALHEVLGIPPNATVQQIQDAYRYWIKRYHPDRVQHLGESHAKLAQARAEQLNSAKEALLKKRST